MFDPRLITNLRRFGSRAEADAYLNFVGDLLAALEIGGDDPRFHFNPTSGAGYVLPLTVNNRYLIAKGRDAGERATWWLIQPHRLEAVADTLLYQWMFSQKRHDPPDGAPRLAQLPAAFIQAHRDTLFAAVLEIAARELAACRGTTPGRRAHSPVAYALALDDTSRAELLDGVAFGVKGQRQIR